MQKVQNHTEIIALNKAGLQNKDIAKQFGIHFETVRRILEQYGLRSNYRLPIEMVGDSQAKCKKCGDIKNIKEFQISNRGTETEYRYAYCNFCRNKKIKIRLSNDIEGYLTEIYRKVVKRHKGKESVLAKEDFIAQYYSQNGKCFYTDELMICVRGQGKNRNGLSADKINPSKGYVLGNVVFCTSKINLCKNDLTLEEIKKWMPEWHHRIEKFSRSSMKKSELLERDWPGSTQALNKLGYDPDWTMEVSDNNLDKLVEEFYPKSKSSLEFPGRQSVINFIRGELGLQFLDGPLSNELHPTFVYLDPNKGRIKLKLFGSEFTRKWIATE